MGGIVRKRGKKSHGGEKCHTMYQADARVREEESGGKKEARVSECAEKKLKKGQFE